MVAVVVIAPASSRHPCGPCSPRWGTRRRPRRGTPRRMVRTSVDAESPRPPSTVSSDRLPIYGKEAAKLVFIRRSFPAPFVRRRRRRRRPSLFRRRCQLVLLCDSPSPSWAFDVKSSAQEDRPELPSLRPPFVRSHLSVVGWFCSVIFHAFRLERFFLICRISHIGIHMKCLL